MEPHSEQKNNLFNQTNNSESKYQSREEYIEKLKNWLDEARLWHTYCAGFPYYVNIQNQNATAQANFNNIWNNWNNFMQQPQPQSQPQPQQQQPAFNNGLYDGPVFQPGRVYEFRIPPLWKRLAAETIDFLILLLIKLIITIFLTQSFYIINIDYYDLNELKKNLGDPKIAFQMSVELISLEFLHRSIVCLYEVYWLKGEMCSTPGKRYLGMIVVQVDTITPVIGTNDSIVKCTNVQPLGLRNAIIRAVLKNIVLAVMLPVCFVLYIFRYNRTGYDAVVKGLVVEYPPISSHL